MTPSEAGKLLNKRRNEALTPERRREIAKKAGAVANSASPEARSARQKKAYAKRRENKSRGTP